MLQVDKLTAWLGWDSRLICKPWLLLWLWYEAWGGDPLVQSYMIEVKNGHLLDFWDDILVAVEAPLRVLPVGGLNKRQTRGYRLDKLCQSCLFNSILPDNPGKEKAANNPNGNNGADNGTWPEEDVLEASLKRYARSRDSFDTRVRKLEEEHGLMIG
ncbi:hypothetical protein DFH08DRAFT_934361 [Mycena albidolilacea]|uniref:Uncharacterized protein n=1 Tax=Mycena albidolilacea TaxID=1033008 RepID=A0AAD7AAB7_9AGAR|nr:hypothetical protein DFH08DRAFT_934361 [Mycena albidolilacea]